MYDSEVVDAYDRGSFEALIFLPIYGPALIVVGSDPKSLDADHNQLSVEETGSEGRKLVARRTAEKKFAKIAKVS